jgi:hypothetical protein
MNKRKHYAQDTKIKDNAVLLIAPFVIWCLMVGFVTLMVYVTE